MCFVIGVPMIFRIEGEAAASSMQHDVVRKLLQDTPLIDG